MAFKIKEAATLVGANLSQAIDEVKAAAAAAAGISQDTCHNILSDDLNISRVTQHSVSCIQT
jgi:hypothetical protein